MSTALGKSSRVRESLTTVAPRAWEVVSSDGVGGDNFWSDTGGWSVTGVDYVYTLWGNTCLISVAVTASSLSAPGATYLYMHIPVTCARGTPMMHEWTWFGTGASGTAYAYTGGAANDLVIAVNMARTPAGGIVTTFPGGGDAPALRATGDSILRRQSNGRTGVDRPGGEAGRSE